MPSQLMPCENDSCKSRDTSDFTSPTQSLDSYHQPQTCSSSILPSATTTNQPAPKANVCKFFLHTYLSYPSSQQVQESLPSKAFPKQPVSLNLLLQPHIPSQCDLWLNYFPGLSRVLHLHPASRMITCVLVTPLCLTHCDPMDCCLPGSSVHGILQARIPAWVAISFSRGSFQPRDRTLVSCIASRFFIL